MQVEPLVIDDPKGDSFVEDYTMETYNDWYHEFLCEWTANPDYRGDEDSVDSFDIDSIGFWLYENKYTNDYDISDIAIYGHYCFDPDFEKNIKAIDNYLKLEN